MKWMDEAGKKEIDKDFAKLKRYCSIIRVIAHTQVCHDDDDDHLSGNLESPGKHELN